MLPIRIPEINTTLFLLQRVASATIAWWFIKSWFTKQFPEKINFFETKEGEAWLTVQRVNLTLNQNSNGQNLIESQLTISDMRQEFPDDYIIAFVRNPYDLICSHAHGTTGDPNPITEKYLIQGGWHGISEQGQVKTVDVMPDFLGHFETLQKDLKTLTKILDFPTVTLKHIHKHEKKAKKKMKWQDFYGIDQKAINRINYVFKKDFKQFGYNKI